MFGPIKCEEKHERNKLERKSKKEIVSEEK